MKKLLIYTGIMFSFWGCAELDQAGNVVLREMSSINVDNPESHEEAAALPANWGADVDDGNP